MIAWSRAVSCKGRIDLDIRSAWGPSKDEGLRVTEPGCTLNVAEQNTSAAPSDGPDMLRNEVEPQRDVLAPLFH